MQLCPEAPAREALGQQGCLWFSQETPQPHQRQLTGCLRSLPECTGERSTWKFYLTDINVVLAAEDVDQVGVRGLLSSRWW